jgi:hypothetical protein
MTFLIKMVFVLVCFVYTFVNFVDAKYDKKIKIGIFKLISLDYYF